MQQKRQSAFDRARDAIANRGREIIENEFSANGSKWIGAEYWTINPTRADSKIGSFSINESGACSDFADGDCPRDVIGLVNRRLGRPDTDPAGAEYIAEKYGSGHISTVPAPKPKKQAAPKKTIHTPPPGSVPMFDSPPDLLTEFVPGFMVARWNAPGGKEIRPRMFDGTTWQPTRPDVLPLYRPDRIRESETVLIVEGEKCVHAAESLELLHACTTWHGGAKAISKVDLSPLAGRDLILWPDNDEPGREAMQYIADHARAESIAWVSTEGMETGADIADLDPDEARERIMRAVTEKAAPEPQPPAAESFSEYTTLDRIPTRDEADEIVDTLRAKCGKPKGDLSTFAYVRELISIDSDFRWLVRYDEAREQITYHKRYKSIDEIYTAILNRCAVYGMSISMQTRRDVVDTIISRPENRYNSIMELLERVARENDALPIDDAMDIWMSNFLIDGSEDSLNPITDGGWIDYDAPGRPVMTGTPIPTRYLHREVWVKWWTRHLCHLYRAFDEEKIPMDIVPILVGAQGVGKSTLARALAINPRDFFVDLGDKVGRELGSADSIRMIAGKIIAELGEMASIKKQDVDSVKSFISQTSDTYTQKYKEGTTAPPRTCSFIGTSNPEQFLQDFSGNRRFFPLRIQAINRELTLGESGRQIIGMMYATFSKIALEILQGGSMAVADASKMSENLERWLIGARDRATDMPVAVEKIQEVCLSIEAVFADNGGKLHPADGRKLQYLSFKISQIADLVYGAGNHQKADRNFGRYIDKVLQAMGYKKSVCRIAGLTTRGWQKTTEACIEDAQARWSDDAAGERARIDAGLMRIETLVRK